VTSLAWDFSKQSCIKQFLSEGDKIIVRSFATLDDQGGYAVALNYGTLVCDSTTFDLIECRLSIGTVSLPAYRRILPHFLFASCRQLSKG
jgi:hypothetical protein